jgi:hypothetical protein
MAADMNKMLQVCEISSLYENSWICELPFAELI